MSAASSPVWQFIFDAQRLAETGRVEAALDLIYEHLDEMMRRGELGNLDGILCGLPVADLPTDVLLGILSASLPMRARVSSRADFFSKVEKTLKERGEWEAGLLTGLE